MEEIAMESTKRGLWRTLLRAGVLIFLAISVCLSAAPPSAQDQPGHPDASIEAAKAPAVAARRARLMEIHKDAVIIIPSQHMARSGMQDNLDFVYLTGFKEADAVLVLDPGGSPRETIFRRAAGGFGAGSTMGRMSGPGGPDASSGARSRQTIDQPAGQGPSGPDKGLAEKPSTQLSSTLFGMVRTGRAKHVFLPFSDLDFLARTFGAAGLPNPLTFSDAILNIDPTLSEMRLTKDADEIAALREAIDLTAEALDEAFRAAEPGTREVDLAAILRYTFDRRETEDSFLQAASGPNSTNIHFGATARPLASGDLVVFDVGAWIRGYTSDISRTIPANGRFTKDERAIYALVLEAEKAGCRELVPGVTFKAVQTEVEDILMAGLEKLGLVTDVKSPWQRRLYIQHGFGHGIGLDVHDVWNWHSPRLDKVVMAPGMVMTMEPGLYFPEVRFDAFLDALKGKAPDPEIAAFRAKVGPIYKRYVGMGVRIEDDVLITEGGSEILSSRVPKEIADVEKLMREKSAFNLIR
jgi:Xaa-Pro aminopeptidase